MVVDSCPGRRLRRIRQRLTALFSLGCFALLPRTCTPTPGAVARGGLKLIIHVQISSFSFTRASGVATHDCTRRMSSAMVTVGRSRALFLDNLSDEVRRRFTFPLGAALRVPVEDQAAPLLLLDEGHFAVPSPPVDAPVEVPQAVRRAPVKHAVRVAVSDDREMSGRCPASILSQFN